MVVNGFISYKMVTGGGNDEFTGKAIPVNISWSNPIECFIKTNNHNNRGTYQDGKFSVSAYEVLIQTEPFHAERVKLQDMRGREIGEFQVQDIQSLDLVQKVKIVV